jgi:ABC-type multidrug transport system fused ATPase/permease subunit
MLTPTKINDHTHEEKEGVTVSRVPSSSRRKIERQTREDRKKRDTVIISSVNDSHISIPILDSESALAADHKEQNVGVTYAAKDLQSSPSEQGVDAEEMIKLTRIQIMKRMAPLIFTRKNALNISGTCILTGVGIGLNIISPYLYSEAIEMLYSHESQQVLGVKITPQSMVALYNLAWTLAKLTPVQRRKIVTPVVSNTRAELIAKFSSHLVHLSHRYHLSTSESKVRDVLVNIYEGSTDYTRNMLNEFIPTTMEAIAAFTILSVWYGPIMGISLVATLAGYITYNLKTAEKIAAVLALKEAKGTESYHHLMGLSSTYENIHYFNNVDHELKILAKLTAEHDAAADKELYTIDNIACWQLVIPALSLLVLSLYIGDSVESEEYTANDFAIVTFYLLQFFGFLANYGSALSKIEAAFSNLNKAYNFFELKPDVEDKFPDKLLDVRPRNSGISFKNVVFSYKDREPTLNGATFTIPAGQKTGIVAVSGGGKSSLAHLLFRFYDFKSGEITINGKDIRKVSLTSLRSAISIVPQTPILFNDSIANNIRYGGLSVDRGIITEEEVKHVVKAACLDQYVAKLKDGLDTKVGEKGKMISGGQLQRVAIARAMLKKPSIYILDEATSALDGKTESEIQTNIDNITKGTTTLVITHRLPTIRNADKIIVLKDGKVAEQGTHYSLLRQGGEYKTLWESQSIHYAEKPEGITSEHRSVPVPSQPIPIPSSDAGHEYSNKKRKKTTGLFSSNKKEYHPLEKQNSSESDSDEEKAPSPNNSPVSSNGSASRDSTPTSVSELLPREQTYPRLFKDYGSYTGLGNLASSSYSSQQDPSLQRSDSVVLTDELGSTPAKKSSGWCVIS